MKKNELSQIFSHKHCNIRDEEEHHRVDHLSELSKKARQHWSKVWGLNQGTFLLDIPEF